MAAFLDPAISFSDIASRFSLGPCELLDWFARSDIAAHLAAIQALADLRIRLLEPDIRLSVVRALQRNLETPGLDPVEIRRNAACLLRALSRPSHRRARAIANHSGAAPTAANTPRTYIAPRPAPTPPTPADDAALVHAALQACDEVLDAAGCRGSALDCHGSAPEPQAGHANPPAPAASAPPTPAPRLDLPHLAPHARPDTNPRLSLLVSHAGSLDTHTTTARHAPKCASPRHAFTLRRAPRSARLIASRPSPSAIGLLDTS